MTEYVAVDLEMTGLKPSRDKILEIGAVHMKDKKVVAQYQVLVNPGIMIPTRVTELTGITQGMAEKGVTIRQALEGFLEFRKDLPLVGHNISFDYGFLKQNAVNEKLELEAEVLDTLKIARKCLPQLPQKTLHALCDHYEISLKEHHRALADAMATAQLLEELKQQFAEQTPEAFEPAPMQFKVKKQGPITPRQKIYLKELADYHKIELPILDGYTKNEASRLTDRLIAQYGKMTKK